VTCDNERARSALRAEAEALADDEQDRAEAAQILSLDPPIGGLVDGGVSVP
jgi:hypothetical protein